MGFTLVGRVVGIALNLLGPAFHDADNDPFAGRTSPAKAGVPVVVTSDQVFGKADRALDVQLPTSDAEPLTGYGAHRSQTGPSKKISPG
jgi:hypothetical protein